MISSPRGGGINAFTKGNKVATPPASPRGVVAVGGATRVHPQDGLFGNWGEKDSSSGDDEKAKIIGSPRSGRGSGVQPQSAPVLGLASAIQSTKVEGSFKPKAVLSLRDLVAAEPTARNGEKEKGGSFQSMKMNKSGGLALAAKDHNGAAVEQDININDGRILKSIHLSETDRLIKRTHVFTDAVRDGQYHASSKTPKRRPATDADIILANDAHAFLTDPVAELDSRLHASDKYKKLHQELADLLTEIGKEEEQYRVELEKKNKRERPSETAFGAELAELKNQVQRSIRELFRGETTYTENARSAAKLRKRLHKVLQAEELGLYEGKRRKSPTDERHKEKQKKSK
eukprot:g7179.t1